MRLTEFGGVDGIERRDWPRGRLPADIFLAEERMVQAGVRLRGLLRVLASSASRSRIFHRG
jgi:hypothetical protein